MERERGREREKENERRERRWSQALARPVMIDWLAGSQQTDVRPPDQPAHPRANLSHPLLPDPAVHRVSSRSLFLFSLQFSLSLFRLEQPLPPEPSALEHKLAQKARNTMHGALSSLSLSHHFFLLLLSSIPHYHVSLFFRGSLNTLPAILPYRYPFNPFSIGARSCSSRIPIRSRVQKAVIAR